MVRRRAARNTRKIAAAAVLACMPISPSRGPGGDAVRPRPRRQPIARRPPTRATTAATTTDAQLSDADRKQAGLCHGQHGGGDPLLSRQAETAAEPAWGGFASPSPRRLFPRQRDGLARPDHGDGRSTIWPFAGPGRLLARCLVGPAASADATPDNRRAARSCTERLHATSTRISSGLGHDRQRGRKSVMPYAY